MKLLRSIDTLQRIGTPTDNHKLIINEQRSENENIVEKD